MYKILRQISVDTPFIPQLTACKLINKVTNKHILDGGAKVRCTEEEFMILSGWLSVARGQE